MSDRQILFSAPMVRALLAGTKTQTRRVLNRVRVFQTPTSRAFTIKGDDIAWATQNASGWRHLDGDGWHWEADAVEWQAPLTRTRWTAHIGYAPGDRLWVREAWRASKDYDAYPPRELSPWPVHYEADGDPDPRDELGMNGRLRPGIFMPRWASRLTLTVTDVRVQRLQEISEADARAEGVEPYLPCGDPDDDKPAADAFMDLWNSINGPDAWDANPWVVAVSFDVRRGNIDAERVAA